MIEDEKNEKYLSIFKVCLLIIAYIIIGICGLFFILITKVDAASSIKGYNANGEDLQECYDCYSLTSNRNFIDFNYNFDYQQSTNLNIQFNNTIIIRRSSGTLNIGSPSIIVANGYQTYDIGSYCSQVLGTRTDNPGSVYDTITFNYAYSCDIPNYGGNFPNYRSLKVTYTRSFNGLLVGQTNYDNGFQVIETAYNPQPSQIDYTGTINSVGGNIINNNNQNTESIINNNNNNTQSIIDNQNANSQAEIDKIDETFNTCENFTSTNDMGIDGKYLTLNGEYSDNVGFAVSNYIAVNKGKVYLLTMGTNPNAPSYCIYGKDKSLISCQRYAGNSTFNINMPVNGYIRYSWGKNTTTTLSGEYCYNRIDKQNETSENIESALTDSSVNDPTSSLNGLSGNIGTNSVISDLLLLPVSLYQSILNSINGTCSPFNLGTLYGHSLIMPCLNIQSVLGQVIYGVIDILISGFFILSIRKKFVDIFNSFTSLKVGGNELE